MMGALFIGAVLLFPQGLVGAAMSLCRRRSRPAAMQPLPLQGAGGWGA